MKRITLLIMLLSFGRTSQAQDDRSDEKNILYPTSSQYGVLLHTRGYGASCQFIKQRTVNNLRLLDFSIYELRHPKELLQPNPAIDGSRSYVFGKINNLVAIKCNYGTRYVLADKYLGKDIKVNLNYSFGPVFGWLKPMYYDFQVAQSDGIIDIVPQKFDINNVNAQKNIIGFSALPKGLNESFFIYGANAKTSLSFEWGNSEYKFYSLETGVTVDAFPTPVPIFAGIKNDQVFINLYLCLTYGTRK